MPDARKEMESEEKLVTVKDAMQILGKSRTTLHHYEKKGLLIPIKFGARMVRYKLSDVLSLATQCPRCGSPHYDAANQVCGYCIDTFSGILTFRGESQERNLKNAQNTANSLKGLVGNPQIQEQADGAVSVTYKISTVLGIVGKRGSKEKISEAKTALEKYRHSHALTSTEVKFIHSHKRGDTLTITFPEVLILNPSSIDVVVVKSMEQIGDSGPYLKDFCQHNEITFIELDQLEIEKEGGD